MKRLIADEVVRDAGIVGITNPMMFAIRERLRGDRPEQNSSRHEFALFHLCYYNGEFLENGEMGFFPLDALPAGQEIISFQKYDIENYLVPYLKNGKLILMK